MEYGLIGGRLGHSYSKVIHEMLCGYRYDLCPLPTEEEVRAFLTRRQFRAINVRCTRGEVQGQDRAHSGHRRHPQHHLGRGP